MPAAPWALRFVATGAAALLVLTSCGGTNRSPSAAPPTSGPAPKRTASATSTVVPYSWQRHIEASLDIGGGPTSTLSAVLAPASTGESWLIAGTRIAADGTTTATVWSSADARTWSPLSLQGHDSQALAAAQWGVQRVIVGSVGTGNAQRAAVWISAGPTQPFEAVPESSAFAPAPASAPTTTTPTGAAAGGTGSSVMDVVGAGTDGVFAVGAASGQLAMWYSTDGMQWQRVPGAERLFAAAANPQVSSILVGPNGVDVTGSVQGGTDTIGALWTSSDGISWGTYRPPDDPFRGPNDHVIEGITSTGTSLVAVGAARSGPDWTPATWVSPDGSAWTEANEAMPAAQVPQVEEGGSVVRAVAASASGLVAVGGSSTAQRVWTSPNGRTWTETRLPPTAADATNWTADLVASDGETTVILDSEAGEPHVLVEGPSGWRDVSAHTAVFGAPRATATPVTLLRRNGRLMLVVDIDRPAQAIGGTASTDAAVLDSSDAAHWSVIADGPIFAGAHVDAVTTSGSGLIAVGSESARGTSEAVIWTSGDGRRWIRAARFGDEPQAATAIAVIGADPIAVGWGPRSPGDASSGSQPTALAWSSSAGGWQAAGPLDDTPAVGAEHPVAACADDRTLVVVGSATRSAAPATSHGATTPATTGAAPTTTVPITGNGSGVAGQGDDGTLAASWSTSNGLAWTPGIVSPLTGTGAAVGMIGCVATTGGFIAYGQAPTPGGRPVPAIWTSPDGSTWTLVDTPSLDGAGAAPFTDLVVDGATMFAVSGGATPAGTDPEDPSMPVAEPLLSPAVPAGLTGPDGAAGVWNSTDGGATWSQLATSGAPWSAGRDLDTSLVASLATGLVVVGEVDGRLAVWSGVRSGS